MMAVAALELVIWPTADEGQGKILAGKYCASKGYGGPGRGHPEGRGQDWDGPGKASLW